MHLHFEDGRLIIENVETDDGEDEIVQAAIDQRLSRPTSPTYLADEVEGRMNALARKRDAA